jgi:hypothetical protein
MTAAQVIYSLCAFTALACTVLLARSWLATRSPLLFWSVLCFAGLTVSNVLLVLDRLVLGPAISLAPLRLTTTLGAVMLLVYGLIQSDR